MTTTKYALISTRNEKKYEHVMFDVFPNKIENVQELLTQYEELNNISFNRKKNLTSVTIELEFEI